MEAQSQSKNFEIYKLFNRPCYCQVVNHEMSQRNQKNVGKG
ncbi:hypothetical protein Hdeb2414_s0023g00633181 [Helianthus debilis subsp. tardiflorus]